MRLYAAVCALLILVPVTAHAGEAVPAPPSGVDIDLVSGRITWTDNSTDEVGFRISYAISLRNGAPRTLDLTAAANATSATITDPTLLKNGDVIDITVVAFSTAAETRRRRG